MRSKCIKVYNARRVKIRRWELQRHGYQEVRIEMIILESHLLSAFPWANRVWCSIGIQLIPELPRKNKAMKGGRKVGSRK